MEKVHETVRFENLIYIFKGSAKNKDLIDFIDAETLFNDTKLKIIKLQDVEKKSNGV